MKAKDLKIVNNDLYINPITGDFEIVDSDQQHIQDLIESNVGSWKEFPLIGVGLKNYLNSSNQIEILKRQIKKALEQDGYKVLQLEISDDFIIKINAERIK